MAMHVCWRSLSANYDSIMERFVARLVWVKLGATAVVANPLSQWVAVQVLILPSFLVKGTYCRVVCGMQVRLACLALNWSLRLCDRFDHISIYANDVEIRDWSITLYARQAYHCLLVALCLLPTLSRSCNTTATRVLLFLILFWFTSN